MKELKSKKTGAVTTLSDEEYNDIIIADRERQVKLLNNYLISDIRVRNIIPSIRPVVPELKEIKIEQNKIPDVKLDEVKPKIKKNEG